MTPNARVVTFGEVMLRLKSPGLERLFQSPMLEASFGGAERAIGPGRFVMSSGLFTRRGADGPVGLWLSSGVVVALPGVSSFGGARVTYRGVFMDFDGRAQSVPDINTRGMLVYGKHGSVMRFFMDPYGAVSMTGLGPAQ